MIICFECCKRERWPTKGRPTELICEVCHRELWCYDIDIKNVRSFPKDFEKEENGWRTVWTDGSVDRGGQGVLAVLSKGFVRIKGTFPHVTSSIMEYKAVINALEIWPDDDLVVYCDWFSLVEQVMDRKQPKNEGLYELWNEVYRLRKGRRTVFYWRIRSQNKAGIFLEMIRHRFSNRRLWPEQISLEISGWGGEQ